MFVGCRYYPQQQAAAQVAILWPRPLRVIRTITWTPWIRRCTGQNWLWRTPGTMTGYTPNWRGVQPLACYPAYRLFHLVLAYDVPDVNCSWTTAGSRCTCTGDWAAAVRACACAVPPANSVTALTVLPGVRLNDRMSRFMWRGRRWRFGVLSTNDIAGGSG